MAVELKIRAADPDDYDEIIELFDSWEPNNWDRKFAVKYYRDFFDNVHRCVMDEVFVGVVKGKIVGVTGYCPNDDKPNDTYWLNWFYIHKDSQKHGYGGLLLDHVIGILKDNKVRKLNVDTSSDWFYALARALYEGRRFSEVEVFKDYYGKGEDQIIFGMNLRVQSRARRGGYYVRN